jgi:hypothetical protein
LPLHDVETIRLVDVITDVRTAQENQVVSLQHLAPLKAVDAVMAGMDSSRISVLGEQTLRSLVESVDDELEATLKRLVG